MASIALQVANQMAQLSMQQQQARQRANDQEQQTRYRNQRAEYVAEEAQFVTHAAQRKLAANKVDAEKLNIEGKLLLDAGQVDLALDKFKRALELSENAQTKFNIASCYLLQENFALALQLMNQTEFGYELPGFAEIKKKCTDSLEQKIRQLLRQAEMEFAVDDFGSAIQTGNAARQMLLVSGLAFAQDGGLQVVISKSKWMLSRQKITQEFAEAQNLYADGLYAEAANKAQYCMDMYNSHIQYAEPRDVDLCLGLWARAQVHVFIKLFNDSIVGFYIDQAIDALDNIIKTYEKIKDPNDKEQIENIYLAASSSLPLLQEWYSRYTKQKMTEPALCAQRVLQGIPRYKLIKEQDSILIAEQLSTQFSAHWNKLFGANNTDLELDLAKFIFDKLSHTSLACSLIYLKYYLAQQTRSSFAHDLSNKFAESLASRSLTIIDLPIFKIIKSGTTQSPQAINRYIST